MLPHNSVANDNSRKTLHNKKWGATSELSTKLTSKDQRQIEYIILEKTEFQTEKKLLLKGLSDIRATRIVEFMGRYRPTQQKLERLTDFQNSFRELKDNLSRLLRCCQQYSELMRANMYAKRKSPPPPSSSFAKEIKLELQDIEMTWSEVFHQGSLKRLNQVISLAGLDEHQVDMTFDMNKWLLDAEEYFRSIKRSGSCCFNMCMLT